MSHAVLQSDFVLMVDNSLKYNPEDDFVRRKTLYMQRVGQRP